MANLLNLHRIATREWPSDLRYLPYQCGQAFALPQEPDGRAGQFRACAMQGQWRESRRLMKGRAGKEQEEGAAGTI
jgi:hypothetical protein